MPPAEDLTNVLLDGRYRLTRLMGAGGMGQVYEGTHELLERKVAVKVLLPQLAYEPKFRERFLREAKAASKVRHPNVVQILDFGDTPGGSVYFAMEYLEGRDLHVVLHEEGPLGWPRARELLLQIVSALVAAHERKIIHRDLKPANFFLIEERGRELVKVLDFGIAKLVTDGTNDDSSLAKSLTSTGEVFGTAKYMAPEQAHGAADDPRVDVYSLGVVAYELLTGQVPFTGTSVFQIITRHVNEPPRPPRELVPEIPAQVEAVILRALAKRPEDRFASMAELERALMAIPGDRGVPTSASVVDGSWPAPGPSGTVPLVVRSQPPVATPSVAAPVFATAVIPMPAIASRPRGVDDSEAGGATAPLRGASDSGSATGPQGSRATGSHAAETDALVVGPRPTVARRGAVLGLVGALGGGALLVAGLLAWSSSSDDARPAEPAAVVAAPVVSDEVEPPPASAPLTTPAPRADPSTPPVEAAPIDAAPEETAPIETAPPKPKSTAAPKPSKPPAPLTDAKATSRLARALAKKCGALGPGTTPTVTVVVGSDGRVLSKSVRGAIGELEKCLVAGTEQAEFPAGTTRSLPIPVAL